MGLDLPCLYDSDDEIARQVLDSGHPSLRGITLDRLKERGWMRLDYPEPFVPFADGFPTASGKLEFLSERMATAGLDPLAGYTPPYEAAQRDTPLAARYPLALIAGADHYFLNSLFANVADQVKRSGPPVVRIHPEDATRAGTRDRARGPRVQRSRRVRRARRGHRSRPPRCGGQHQGPMAALRERAARPSTPPWTSETPTWVAGRSSTTTAWRSSGSRMPTRVPGLAPQALPGPRGRSDSSRPPFQGLFHASSPIVSEPSSE